MIRYLILLCCLSLTKLIFADTSIPFGLPELDQIKKIRSASIHTNKGVIIIKLFPKLAPWHVSNFKYLADQKFYDNLNFHIYEPGYVIQTGAPTVEVNSGPGYSLPPEFSQHIMKKGSLVMVRKPNDLDLEHTRNSHGSQFRILLKRVPSMDERHTVFGEVVKGMDILENLRKNDTIITLKVYVN